MLVLSRGPEEAIMIGDRVEVRILEVRGDRVRLGIVAPTEVPVHRKEIYLNIQRENRAAAAPDTAGVDRALDLLGGLAGVASGARTGSAGVATGSLPREEGGRGEKGREGPGRAANRKERTIG